MMSPKAPAVGTGATRQWYFAAKRAIDVTIALVVLVGGLPLWLLIGSLIRVTSPGPALFRRRVVGLRGRPFTYFKFRTMLTGDDSSHRQWLTEFVLNDKPFADGVFKMSDDPRITRFGGWLRRSSLDEIPQLLNVLLGQMSVVGPRPPIEHEYALYDDRARGRLAVRPGITGLHQVTGRSSVPFSMMVATDLEYVRRCSLSLDLWILLRTVSVVLSGRGAG